VATTLYQDLFQISKLLLAAGSSERTAELCLARLVEGTGAAAGFLVVREEGSYRRKFEVGAPASRSEGERRFSRTLVREALESGRLCHIPNLLADPRFAEAQSVRALGPVAVLAAPLRGAAETWGVVYLEGQGGPAPFSPEALTFVAEFAEVAGLSLERASEREALERRTLSLEGDLFARHDFGGIVTRDPAMIDLLRVVAQVAPADAPVLIEGETGTGKELVARALHVNSGRRGRPFVTLHCAALPATLLEAELFGHVAHAFTDARRDRAGRLAGAHQGTLFLDEAGEMPLEVQAKLLRFLQFGEIQRVGSDQVERIDVRVVAATHRDLAARVKEGSFREDLYFRLKVLKLRLPALRERPDDVLLLADHFLRKHWRQPGPAPSFTPEVERALAAYPFPGNVRELAHLVERASLLARGPEIHLGLLPEEVLAAITPRAGAVNPEPPALTAEGLNAARGAAAATAEHRFLTALLERAGGNVSRAARESGIHRSYLQRLLARHGLGGATAGEEG
jgi:transcriptional regulator with GAF, ATPase, and Fis domain